MKRLWRWEAEGDNLNALNATDYVNRVKIAENDLNL